jgi:hypothetical protein
MDAFQNPVFLIIAFLTQRAQSVSQRTQRISFADFADSLR